MNYYIRELDSFTIIGQEIELTNYSKRNVQISTHFWRKFNLNLKNSYLSQTGNWIKYAFMERRNGTLYYFCAIHKKNIVPIGFNTKEIKFHRYLVVEHLGAMNKIYDTYNKIYQEILPNTNYEPSQEDFIHFEKYDYRFHWNRENSIIEIWVPIKS